MKLYWPMAREHENSEILYTYDPCLSTSECFRTYECWEKRNYILEEMWINVEDSSDKTYKETLKVVKNFSIEDNLEKRLEISNELKKTAKRLNHPPLKKLMLDASKALKGE